MVGIARSKDLKKFGLHDILRDFTTTIKELSTNGIPMKIGDENIAIKGDLIYAVCDTPVATTKVEFAYKSKIKKLMVKVLYVPFQTFLWFQT